MKWWKSLPSMTNGLTLSTSSVCKSGTGLSAVFGPSPSFFPSCCFGDLPAPTLPRSHSCDHVFRLDVKVIDFCCHQISD